MKKQRENDMYFLIKGKQGEDNVYTFEYVIKAENQDEAIGKLEKDEIVLEIREIFVEERIDRELADFAESAKWDYIRRKYGNMSIREYSKIQKQVENDPELKYQAIKEFNAKQRLIKRLSRQARFGEMTLAEVNEKCNQLIDAINAEDEDAFNKIMWS